MPSQSSSVSKPAQSKKNKKVLSEKTGKRRRRAKSSYRKYLHAMYARLEHPTKKTISDKAMTTLNDLAYDIERRIADVAVELAKLENKKTINSTTIRAAVKLVVTPNMEVHCLKKIDVSITNRANYD